MTPSTQRRVARLIGATLTLTGLALLAYYYANPHTGADVSGLIIFAAGITTLAIANTSRKD